MTAVRYTSRMVPGDAGILGVDDRCSWKTGLTPQSTIFPKVLVRCMYASKRGGTYQRAMGQPIMFPNLA